MSKCLHDWDFDAAECLSHNPPCRKCTLCGQWVRLEECTSMTNRELMTKDEFAKRYIFIDGAPTLELKDGFFGRGLDPELIKRQEERDAMVRDWIYFKRWLHAKSASADKPESKRSTTDAASLSNRAKG